MDGLWWWWRIYADSAWALVVHIMDLVVIQRTILWWWSRWWRDNQSAVGVVTLELVVEAVNRGDNGGSNSTVVVMVDQVLLYINDQ